jgi:hypothetical protein
LVIPHPPDDKPLVGHRVNAGYLRLEDYPRLFSQRKITREIAARESSLIQIKARRERLT